MKLPVHAFCTSALALLVWIAPLQASSVTCPSKNGPFSATGQSVTGVGVTQAQATADLYSGGMERGLQVASGIVCSDCGSAGPCESFVSFDGTVSGLHHSKIVDMDGNTVGYIAIALFTGTYGVECLEC